MSAFALQLMNEAEVTSFLTFEERKTVLLWQKLVQQLAGAENKSEMAGQIVEATRGHLRISRATLYRKLEAYRAEGVAGLFGAAARNRLYAEISIPPAFVEHCWKVVACQSQRHQGTAAAYRSLFYDWLIPGKVLPGYETDWRGIYSREHDGAPAPAHCPYIPHRCTPRGWGERNLRRYLPDSAALTAARVGTLAARELLPKLPSTRVGLPFGSVFIADDRFHDAQVKFAGNLQPQGVVELGAIELLTGHYCTFGMKPIRERADGTREHIREAFMRYLVADILCRIGYNPNGCQIIGEHGTARVPVETQDLLKRLTGGRVTFETGAILNAPIAKGLLPGAARGNFRMKAALESAHGRYKNDMALLPGQKGADPEHAPEDLPAKQSYHRQLMKACIALAEQNPDLCQRLASPFPDYHSYVQAVALVYDRIAADTSHNLEGWFGCGFSIDEFRLFGDHWQPMSELDKLKPEQRGLIRAALQADFRSVRPRKMSRMEAFVYQQQRTELIRLDDRIVPELLGPDLGDVLTVEKDGTLQIADKYLPATKHHVAAYVKLPTGCTKALDRGSKWLVHFNPLNASQAFISTPDGIYVGKAPVLLPGTKLEPNHANLATLNAMERDMLKKLAPVAEQRIRQRREATEQNIIALGGEIPAFDDAKEASQENKAARKRFKPADLMDDGDLSVDEGFDQPERFFDPASLLDT